jgi:hypothetical protein
MEKVFLVGRPFGYNPPSELLSLPVALRSHWLRRGGGAAAAAAAAEVSAAQPLGGPTAALSRARALRCYSAAAGPGFRGCDVPRRGVALACQGRRQGLLRVHCCEQGCEQGCEGRQGCGGRGGCCSGSCCRGRGSCSPSAAASFCSGSCWSGKQLLGSSGAGAVLRERRQAVARQRAALSLRQSGCCFARAAAALAVQLLRGRGPSKKGRLVGWSREQGGARGLCSCSSSCSAAAAEAASAAAAVALRWCSRARSSAAGSGWR